MIEFGMIGGGWRSHFFLRVARALPEQFLVSGMVVRNASKGAELEHNWGVKTYRTLDELLHSERPHFIVVSVPWEICAQMLHILAERGIPALAETPPAPDLSGLLALNALSKRGAKIQVAEQYHLQPLHAARIAFVQAGHLGTITQAQQSIAHGYHGISLLRKFLNIKGETAKIHAQRFTAPLVAGPDQNSGPPTEERLTTSEQVIAYLDFGDKLGVYDFTDDQYFSWIRSPRLLVRGERGEINNTQARYLENYRTPITLNFLRQDAGEDGNLEGYYHKGILAGNQWMYQNPYPYARLSDDEIAVATCLLKMENYLAGGPAFYSLAEASQDHYLNIMIKQALTSEESVQTMIQPWSDNL